MLPEPVATGPGFKNVAVRPVPPEDKSRNGIIPVSAPGPAPQNTAGGDDNARKGTVHIESINCKLRAGRDVTA